MPNYGFLPSREAELLTWTTNFNNQVQADGAGVGLSAEQATALGAAQAAFASAYDTAHEAGAAADRPATARVLKGAARPLAGSGRPRE